MRAERWKRARANARHAQGSGPAGLADARRMGTLADARRVGAVAVIDFAARDGRQVVEVVGGHWERCRRRARHRGHVWNIACPF